MSFTTLGITLGRGEFNNYASATGVISHTYKNLDDLLASIALSGYFPNYLGGSSGQVLVNDLLYAVGSDLADTFVITSVAPLVITPQAEATGNVTGAISSTDNAIVRWDGATGKIIQNSSSTLSDAGLLATPNVTVSSLSTGVIHSNSSGVLSSSSIVNADIDAAAAIVDTKLATLSTAGKVANSATTAASANTASAIVARNGSGNFTAGLITTATGVAFPTTGGTPATLNFFQDWTLQALDISGALEGSIAAHFSRVGNVVFCKINGITGSLFASEQFISLAGIPTQFLPTVTASTIMSWAQNFVDNGAVVIGTAHIADSLLNTIHLTKTDASVFSGTVGFRDMTFQWPFGV